MTRFLENTVSQVGTRAFILIQIKGRKTAKKLTNLETGTKYNDKKTKQNKKSDRHRNCDKAWDLAIQHFFIT